MKSSVGGRNMTRGGWSAWRTGVVAALLTGLLAATSTLAQEAAQKPSVSPEQQKRVELMKSKGTEASMTILPVRLGGRPFDRVSEVVGQLLEGFQRDLCGPGLILCILSELGPLAEGDVPLRVFQLRQHVCLSLSRVQPRQRERLEKSYGQVIEEEAREGINLTRYYTPPAKDDPSAKT